ncbi:uncharacterized protein BO87DRAFT_400630 [Aspergillus neoniger CBS 115656]|uniref:Uncharacterized protein n=1 Tax=Aspergillus neoniger (strain CBS 115656) TaxID=1448310 RepID=A0A318YPQ6_ASPNB|nr:hypothetical protein BO87DRAFT_400630 [Aspergillus neoniger CBS 115656]PYH30168.1 hypothetical protein BO87DRAFT_400630 [Aspergillus neoniger CBS 115656]
MAMCLTEGLEQQFNTDRKDGSFAFFFCEANHDTQNTATAILRGILWQQIRQNPILQDWLIGSERFTSKVRILITSRPYYEIASCLGFFPSRDIATFVEERKTDIQLFIRQKVGDLSTRKGYHDKMKDQIQEILEAKADETFLWIGLTCDELKNVDLQDTLAFLNNLAPAHMRLREEISTWGDFIPYCSQFWMEHAHLSGMVFDPAKVTETHFLTLDSPSRDLWLRTMGNTELGGFCAR